MYSCIIIDDELQAMEGLRKYIESVPYLELVQSFSDPIKALKKISDGEQVDIIFMDVDMPKINGIELSKVIRSKTRKLIFTTAHSQYAFEAFEAEADAYLLKPYTIGKFLITVNRLFPENSSKLTGLESNEFFFVKSKDVNLKILKIRYDEIAAVESKLNYVTIHTFNRQITTYMQLSEIARILSASTNFIQLHRSYIIAQSHIATIDGNAITMTNGLSLTVGEVYRKDFNTFVSKNLINAGKKK